MNLPKLTFYIFTLVLLFSQVSLLSQNDSAKKWLHFSVNAGLIVNKTYSGFNDSYTPNAYPYYALYVTKTKNAPEYSAGYSFGITSLLGKKSKYNFILGVSISSTQSKRHESYYDNPHSLGPFYHNQHSELDFSSLTIYANLEIGFKFRVFKKFSLQPSFLFHYNLHTKEKQVGTRDLDERNGNLSVFPPTYNTSQTTEQINETKIYHGQIEKSLRLTAFYEFKIRQRGYNVYAFWNRGLTYHLSWYGLGFSVFL